MERMLTDNIVQARKHYKCDACEQWNRSGYTINDCETNDQRLIVEADIADNFKILRGQTYRKLIGIQDGSVCTYRARVGMDSVCRDLEMWDDYYEDNY